MDKFCQFVTMRIIPPDPKHNGILTSAWDAFAAYGYRKTSMDDIAKGAGMSRPALYLHFKNKEAIVQSLTVYVYYNAIRDVYDGLVGAAPSLNDKLFAAFKAQGGPVMETILTSPHGRELLDVGSQYTAEIIEEGQLELKGVYARWLAEASAEGSIVLPADAETIADMILVSTYGAKQVSDDYESYLLRLRAIADTIAAALKPNKA